MSNRTTRLRRNGKLEACEECRGHKIRCDHALPRCGRCSRKDIKCTYITAPMTRASQSRSNGAGNSINLAGTERLSSTGPVSSDSLNQQALGQLNGRQTTFIQSTALHSPESSTPNERRTASGFLGPTSFAEGFKRGQQDADDPWIQPLINIEPVQPTPVLALLSTERISTGSRILPLLKLLPGLRTALSRYWDVTPTLNAPRVLLEKFVDALISIIPAVSTEKGAREVSALLLRNSQLAVPIKVDATPSSYSSEFIGSNLRWEAIAYIFALAGMACYVSEEMDSAKSSATQIRIQLAYGANAAIELLDSVESLTDVTIWAQVQNVVLITFIYGDVSHLGWRQLNMLSSSIFAMGLHRDPDESKIPFWLGQLRRRIFSSAFSLDTTLSTFFGRPPRIPSSYCSKKLALDLSEDDIYASDSVRNAAIAKLDPQGWNTNGSYHLSTWSRFKTIASTARESALRLSLGVDLEDLEQNARNTLTSIEHKWASIPDFLKYDESIWDSEIVPNTCFNLLYYHLRFLYSRFLVQRVLVRHFNEDPHQLFSIAQSMLTGTMAISTYRDRRGVLLVDFAWVALFYGLPASALLLMELLKQKESAAGASRVKLPRGAILRQISVFTSALEWVAKPGNGNFDLVQGSKRMLEKILDSILDDEVSESMAGVETINAQDPISWMEDAFGEGWMVQGALAEANADNTTWLNTLDFENWAEQPFWQQSLGPDL